MSSSNSKTSLFDDIDETEDPFAPMEEEEGGGGFLNGPLSGGREGGETPVEGKEEEGSEDFVVVSLRDVTPVAGQGGGVTSDGSRPSSTSGESESDVHKRTLTDNQKSNLRQKAGLVGKRTPSPLDMSRPLSSSPPPHTVMSPTGRERTSSITVKVVKVTSRTPSIPSRESSIASPEPSSDAKSDRTGDEEKDKLLREATAQISQLSHRLQQEQSEAAALRSDKARLEMKLAELKTVEEVLQEEVSKLKGDNLVLKSDLMDATADKEGLEEEVADFRARFELMELAWRQRDEEMEELKKQLEEKQLAEKQLAEKQLEEKLAENEKTIEKPTESEKPSERPPEKSADEQTDRPEAPPTEKPVDKVVEKAKEGKEKEGKAKEGKAKEGKEKEGKEKEGKEKEGKEKQTPVRKGLRKRPNSAESPRARNRSGVHKENTGSVRDTVKKFSAVAGAGSPEVKRIVHPKQATKKSNLTESAKPQEKPATPSTAKGEKPTPVKRKTVAGRPPLPVAAKSKQPTPAEPPSSKVVHKAEDKVLETPPVEISTSKVPPAENSTSEVPPTAQNPTSEVPPAAQNPTVEVPPTAQNPAPVVPPAQKPAPVAPPAQKSTAEVPPAGGSKPSSDQSSEPEPPQATMEVAPAQHWILQDTTGTITAEMKDTAPPAEQDEQKSAAELAIEKLMSTHSPEKEAEEDERKRESTPTKESSEEPEEIVDGKQGEDVPRALKLITAFEQKKSQPAAETPPWKKNLRDELRTKTEDDDAPEEAGKPHKTAALPPRPKPVPVPRISRSKSPEVITRTDEPPKPTPRETQIKATPKTPEPPKATQKPAEPPMATEKPSEPPKAIPKFSEPPKTTSKPPQPPKDAPSQLNGKMSPPAAPSKDEIDGGLLTKPHPWGSRSTLIGDSREVQFREKQNLRRFHSATDISGGSGNGSSSGLGIADKRSSWMPKQDKKREDCAVCGRAVYAMERLEADQVVYHKTCFKCSVCRKTLSTGTYAALQGKIYCKVHFKQLFKIKGNYDEGFGREQHKTKWIKKAGQSEC